MWQAVLEHPEKIIFREIKKPVISNNDVLIKVNRIGICGSDIKAYYGKHPYIKCPIVQGHEFSGVIAGKGKSVRRFNLKDRVTVRPQIVCGQCYQCKQGNYHICDELKVIGCQAEGAAQQYIKVDQSLVVKFPKRMSYEEGAMIEPVAVAVHALAKAGQVRGQKVLVLGAGTIGNLTAQVAKALGAISVAITDLSDYRLKVAKECGVDHTVNVSQTDLTAFLEKRFGKNKADFIFECVGETETINHAVNLARKGSDIIVVGVFDKKPQLNIGLVQDRELRLIGSLMYKREDFIRAIKLIQSKKIRLSPLMSKTFGFRDYPEAYKFIEKSRDEVMKVFIKF